MTSWFLLDPAGPSHTADTGAPETLCGLTCATPLRETGPHDLGSAIAKCVACVEVLQERRIERAERDVEVCSCAACAGSTIGREAAAARKGEP